MDAKILKENSQRRIFEANTRTNFKRETTAEWYTYVKSLDALNSGHLVETVL